MSAANTIQRQPFSAHCALIAPDAMSAAAHYIEREYGYGYRIGVSDEIALRRLAVFEVACSDGSRFNIAADDWGNVRPIPDDLTRDEAIDFVIAMSREACQS